MSWDNKTAGAVIRDEMKAKKVTVATLASEMDRSVNTARRRLNGEGTWHLCEVLSAARVLDLQPSELLAKVEARV